MKHCFGKTDGIRVHWIEAGRREHPTLVLLHGGGIDCAEFSWKTAIPRLSESFHILAPDFPGSGQSEDIAFEHPIPQDIAFLEKWLAQRKEDDFFLAGISMGGAIGLGYTLRNPRRVKKLILVDSYGLSDQVPLGFLSIMSARFHRAYRFVGRLSRRRPGLAVRGLRFILGDPNEFTPEIESDALRLISEKPMGRSWINFMKDEFASGSCRTNFSNDLSGINVPVLLVHGEKDRLISTEHTIRAARLLPDARVELIPGSGHLPPREAPDLFCRLVREFLLGN